jgi:hypothetical protein
LLGFLGCAHVTSRVPVETPAIWVDASAAEPGDGSADRPFRTLTAALAPRARIRIRTGMYEGPFSLPDDVALEGQGNVVLFSERAPVTVKATRAKFNDIFIQGGAVGLEVTEGVEASQLRLSGQRELGAVVRKGASLRMLDSSLDGTVPDIDGIVAEPGSSVTLKNVFVTGAFRRAINSVEAVVALDGARFLGSKEAVHGERGTVTLENVTVAGGRGPAIFLAGATATLKRIEVQGHEYGLLAREVTLNLDGFHSARSQLAGLALVQAKAELANITIEDSGSLAAIQLLQVLGSVREVEIKRAQAFGILWRDGAGSITRAKIYSVAAEGTSSSNQTGGDALHLRGVDATVRGIDVRDAQGSGLFATMAAKVDVEDLSCNRCGYGVVLVERHASVKAKQLKSAYTKVSALSVPDVGSLEVLDIDADSPPGTLVYAECSQGAKVTLHREGITGSTWTNSPCISVVE